MQDNPLLRFSSLPQYAEIQPEHAIPALEQVLGESRQTIESLLEQASFSWDNLMYPMEEISDRLAKVWSPVSHLKAVMNSDAWRDVYNEGLPKLTEFYTWLGQNKSLFEAVKQIKQSAAFDALTAAQQKIINDELRDFELSGVALEGAEKERFAQIQKALNQLTTKFDENVLDATQAWSHHIEDEAMLSGLPEHIKHHALQNAQDKELAGWVLTIDAPTYIAVMKNADSEMLRKVMYEAYTTRASDVGPNGGEFDNSQVMVDILKLRREKAQLLGFQHYADYSLATKMAKSSEQVIDFLNDLADRSKPMAKKEYQELMAFAADEFGQTSLNAWDIAYYSEKLQQQQYAVSQEQLRPYFPEDKVFTGMFEVIRRLYGLTVSEIKDAQVWTDSVRFFEIRDEAGEIRGQFFTDLYARPTKRGGAWMDDYCGRRVLQDGSIQTPVAYLTCNFNKPVAGQQALFTHDDVVTLFHEFGHGLHHMLTRVDYLSAAGINGVAWDAVELPSQFMENYCWAREAVPFFSEHHETHEPLPNELFGSMLAAKNFQSGLMMVRQLEFSLFDFHLHCLAVETVNDVANTLSEVRTKTSVIPVPAFNRFQHSFSHIFAGGYAAGYYSYKWAEVLSSDAFSRFEEEGIFNQATGQAFLTSILECGGSFEPLDLFIRFRGREPSVDALLVHSGIVCSG